MSIENQIPETFDFDYWLGRIPDQARKTYLPDFVPSHCSNVLPSEIARGLVVGHEETIAIWGYSGMTVAEMTEMCTRDNPILKQEIRDGKAFVGPHYVEYVDNDQQTQVLGLTNAVGIWRRKPEFQDTAN